MSLSGLNGWVWIGLCPVGANMFRRWNDTFPPDDVFASIDSDPVGDAPPAHATTTIVARPLSPVKSAAASETGSGSVACVAIVLKTPPPAFFSTETEFEPAFATSR